MSSANDLITWQSLATLAGATTATTVITNSICKVLPNFKNVAALGLGLALFLSVLIALVDPTSSNVDFAKPLTTYVIAVVNGFYVFCASAGLSATGATWANSSTRPPSGKRGGAEEVPAAAPSSVSPRFWRRWL